MKPVPLETQPDRDAKAVIDMLEEILVDARNGKYVHAAFIAVERDGSSVTASTKGSYFQFLLGALEILKFRMLRAGAK